MSSNPDRAIDDVGEYVPHAKKHKTQSGQQSPRSTVRLDALWPAPDWLALVQSGLPRDVVARLSMAYESLRSSPHAEGVFGLSKIEWEEAYKSGISAAKSVFEFVSSPDEIEQMRSSLLVMLELEESTVHDNIRKNAAFWALGRGNGRRIKSPFALTSRQGMLAQWLPELGWPEWDLPFRASIFPVNFTDGNWRICRVEGNTFIEVDDATFKSRASAVESAKRHIANEFETKHAESKRVPKRYALVVQASERLGPDVRNGADVSAEDLMKTYGLRAVQFGNSLSDSQRQVWVNSAFDALADLSKAVAFERRWVGLGGLAIAFGARGQGGAMAHFEPNLNVANLTRERGAGSFAHEWGHALDFRLMKTIGFKPKGDLRLASTMVFHHLTPFLLDQKSLHLLEILSSITEFFRQGRKSSGFVSNARRISEGHRAGKYWCEPHELFARAFEAFVQDSIELDGGQSPWLVFGTGEDDYNSDVLGHPYPLGAERQKLNSLFRELLSTMTGKQT